MRHSPLSALGMRTITCRTAVASGALALLLVACRGSDPVDPVDNDPVVKAEKAEVAAQWQDMILSTLQRSRFNTPTYASRSLGYLGLAMYESVVHGDSAHVSMSGQLNGLTLPKPDATQSYRWELSMNAAMDTLLKLLYPVPDNALSDVHADISRVHRGIDAKYAANLDPAIKDRSVQFGVAIALALYQWSLTDGGHRGFTRNFDPTFRFPTGPSYWVPPFRGQSGSLLPLHPYWGQNRTFLVADSSIAIPPIEPYSTSPTSRYYRMYRDIYVKDARLTLAERETAAWWGDDPTESASPPGHSFYITGIAVAKTNASLVTAAEAYARTGIAVADAFIHVWKVKYRYFNERPSTYARANFDPTFAQFWPEPPFPAFPSGHAIQAAAAAAVQTAVFGEPFPFTDRLHVGTRRTDDPRFLDLRYPARRFNSFMEAAQECGDSRLLGGIHTAQDNDAGRLDGITIGQHVNQLQWTK